MVNRPNEPGPAGQSWNAQGYDRHGRFVSELGLPLVDMLDPEPGERILDLGCGDGVLTSEIARRGATVTGVDQSPELLQVAAGRGLDVRSMDGQRLAFEGEFDAVFSNAALHWMKDPDAVLAGVARALRPGGRFVAEMGGFGNVAAIVTAVRAVLIRHGHDPRAGDPFYFPTAEDYGARMERAGFRVCVIDLIPRPTPLPTGMRGWLETFTGAFLKSVPAAGRDAILDEVVDLLAPALRDGDGHWIADYVRLRFRATLAEC